MSINNKLHKLKMMTSRISKWDSSGQVFGYFSDLKIDAKEDKIYEFYVYMRILKDLKKNYIIDFIPNGKNVFPRAPGLKKNYSYFRATNRHATSTKFSEYQICYGTKITLSCAPNTLIAPDISFQDINSPLDPSENNVKIIMDVKYKYSSSGKMTVSLIHAFMQQITALQTSMAASENLQFDKLTDFKCNCLITNGDILDIQDQYCRSYYMKQIGKFWASAKITTAG